MVPRLLEQQACVAASHLPSVEREREREREKERDRQRDGEASPYTVIFIVGPLYRDRERLLINALLSLNAARAVPVLAARCSLLPCVALPLLHLPWQHRVQRLFDPLSRRSLGPPLILDYCATRSDLTDSILDPLFPFFLENYHLLSTKLRKRISTLLFRNTFETALEYRRTRRWEFLGNCIYRVVFPRHFVYISISSLSFYQTKYDTCSSGEVIFTHNYAYLSYETSKFGFK